jgi:uncharacterized protein YjbI with pentapeptide repeats
MIEGDRKTAEEIIALYGLGQRLFKNIDIDGCDFARAKLPGIHFEESWIGDSDFREADLQGAVIRNCNVKCAVFADANLQGASFINNALDSANFTRSNVSGMVVLDNSAYGRAVELADIIWESQGPEPEWISRLHPLPQIRKTGDDGKF